MLTGFSIFSRESVTLVAGIVLLGVFTYFGNEAFDDTVVAHLFKNRLDNYSADTTAGYTFQSTCDCRKQRIHLEETTSGYVVSTISENATRKIRMYTISAASSLDRLMCNPYSLLRRGPNTKVISYSLYGSDDRYYNITTRLIKQIHSLYRGWLVRIYHDSSIRDSVRCELECLRDENGVAYDIVDFCDVEQLPVGLNESSSSWNATYLHAMMWRWLPLGDRFVDIFASRDLDAPVFQREFDSVDVWLKSAKPLHIMRGIFITIFYFSQLVLCFRLLE